jgi:hypothetical protein
MSDCCRPIDGRLPLHFRRRLRPDYEAVVGRPFRATNDACKYAAPFDDFGANAREVSDYCFERRRDLCGVEMCQQKTLGERIVRMNRETVSLQLHIGHLTKLLNG